MSKSIEPVSRRRLLHTVTLAGAGLVAGRRGLAQTTIVSESERITAPYGVQVGDLSGGRAVLWSRASKPAATNKSATDADICSDGVNTATPSPAATAACAAIAKTKFSR